jgi:hypothetical protein
LAFLFWILDFGLARGGSLAAGPLGEFGMQNAEFRIQNAEFRTQNAGSGTLICANLR